jgi:hypothetical protein
MRDDDNTRAKGFAFVEFFESRDADDAIHGLDGRRAFGGRTIDVEVCLRSHALHCRANCIWVCGNMLLILMFSKFDEWDSLQSVRLVETGRLVGNGILLMRSASRLRKSLLAPQRMFFLRSSPIVSHLIIRLENAHLIIIIDCGCCC